MILGLERPSREVAAFVADLAVDVQAGSEHERRTIDSWLHAAVPDRCACGSQLRRFERLNGGRCWGCSTADEGQREGPDAALVRRLADCGVPARYRSYTVSGWLGDLPELALEWAVRPSGVLFVCGPPGTGKTHLAVIVSGMIEADRLWLLWQSCRSLPRDLAEDERNGSDRPLWKRLVSCGVLVLDDLGAEPGTAWAADRVGAVLDERYSRALPTLVTSNLTLEEIYRADPRIGSRLASEAVVAPLVGPDRRLVGNGG